MIDAYAAGLIDGEGTIYIDKGLTVRLEVQMTEPALQVLRFLEREYGGTVAPCRPATEKWAASYRWTQFSEAAGATLKRLLPWLWVKREQAELALAMIAVKPKDKTVKWTETQRARGSEYRARMLLLNRKGPSDVSGPDPHAMPGTARVARLADERWVTDQMDLFSAQGHETFSGPWPTSGFMTALGVYSTPGISECPNDVAVSSSLPDVLVEAAPKRFSLSAKAAAGILRRADRRGRALPPALESALSAMAESLRPSAPDRTPTE